MRRGAPAQQVQYLSSCVSRTLFRIHAEAIKNRLDFVTEYALKGVKNPRVGFDELLLLPCTPDEMKCILDTERMVALRKKIIDLVRLALGIPAARRWGEYR